MLYLPAGLPAVETLRQEMKNVQEYVVPRSGTEVREKPQNGLQILFLNLMPQKAVTELDVARSLVDIDLPIVLIPMKISGQVYKNAPIGHMEAYYTDFEDLCLGYYDGLIITGAPIELLKFEEVRYWNELCQIMGWAKSHVSSTLYICWGAQAGLYYHFGVPKYELEQKLFGVFPQQVKNSKCSLMQGMGTVFPMPTSRYTEVRAIDFPRGDELEVIAESEESGIGVVVSHAGREVFITGHLEYEPLTLHNEYTRDLKKGIPIKPPVNYYQSELPELPVVYSWERVAHLFYENWIRTCCVKELKI